MHETDSAPIYIPYHRGRLELPANGVKAVLRNRLDELPRTTCEAALVRAALNEPIASEPLEELARGKRSVCIITSDHTRPVPSKITLPLLLERIRTGNPEAEVSILVATGFHRPTTDEEMAEKFGADMVDRESFVMHCSGRDEDMADLGTLPSGGRCLVNRRIVEADLLIAEGFIEPHFFAGYSGGRKSVLPGAASRTTVLANHCSAFIAHPGARTGNLEGNPIHTDMLWAAEAVGLDFILNVVLDEEKRIVHAVAGHFDRAHRSGCDWLAPYVSVEGVEADIVVSSNGGYPLDQNVYQAVKGMTAAESCCRDGGVIVMAAGCSDGHGGRDFYEKVRNTSPADLLEEVLAVQADATEPDQWEYQILARILARFTVVMVSEPEQHGIIRDMKMIPAAGLDEALETARRICAGNGIFEPDVTAIPDGVGIVVLNSSSSEDASSRQ